MLLNNTEYKPQPSPRVSKNRTKDDTLYLDTFRFSLFALYCSSFGFIRDIPHPSTGGGTVAAGKYLLYFVWGNTYKI